MTRKGSVLFENEKQQCAERNQNGNRVDRNFGIYRKVHPGVAAAVLECLVAKYLVNRTKAEAAKYHGERDDESERNVSEQAGIGKATCVQAESGVVERTDGVKERVKDSVAHCREVLVAP